MCQVFQKNIIAQEEISIEDVGELFRNLHTLKGLSQMANLLEVVAMTHSIEDYVELIRSQKVKLDKENEEVIIKFGGEINFPAVS